MRVLTEEHPVIRGVGGTPFDDLVLFDAGHLDAATSRCDGAGGH